MSTDLASPDIAEIGRRFRDYKHYHKHFKIIDRDERHLVPFVPRRMQRKIINEIIRADKEGRPARIIGLKARQEGMSTAVQTVNMHRALTRKNFHGLTVSHEEESAKTLHAMAETMYAELPGSIKPKKIVGERGKRMHFDNGSQVRVATAGGDGDVGRSSGASLLALSEMAHYPNPKTTLTAALQLVQSKPGTLVFVESTANGVGNLFHSEWLRAERGESPYLHLFFAWFDDPGYRLAGWTWEMLGELDEEEQALVDVFGLSSEQVAWRREVALKDKCSGDEETLHQEYPSTPHEAFISSGLPFFSSRIMNRLRPMAPRSRGAIEERGGMLRFVENNKGPFRYWRVKQRDHKYLVAVDPAGLVKPKEVEAFTSRRDAGDYSAITVWDRSNMRLVAAWHARIDLGLLGCEAARIGKVYDNAIIAVETSGGYGATVNQSLENMGYPSIYLRTIYDDYKKPVASRYGWETTTRNRIPMLETLRDIAREDRDALPMEELHSEMRTFVTNDSGKPEAEAGCHDDLVMSAAIGAELCRQHPQRLRIAA